ARSWGHAATTLPSNPATCIGSRRPPEGRRMSPRRRRQPAPVTVTGMTDATPHRVVVVGGGFGGLEAVKKLARAPFEVTLIDYRNFHLCQPLTYQVATGALSPGEIAYPLRSIFKRDSNVRVILAAVSDFDLDRRQVQLQPVDGLPPP